MTTFIISIKPKRPSLDPLAKQVQAQWVDQGEPPRSADIHTERLYQIKGDLTSQQMETVAQTLLVDPVVEMYDIQDNTGSTKRKKTKHTGWTVDVWPKPGVTDPVGETVEKGLHDCGFKGNLHAASAIRYIFAKAKSEGAVKQFAKDFLANELVHDIHIRKNN